MSHPHRPRRGSIALQSARESKQRSSPCESMACTKRGKNYRICRIQGRYDTYHNERRDPQQFNERDGKYQFLSPLWKFLQ